MANFDNTNSGALFPANHMKVIRQGRIDIEGTEDFFTLVQCETPSGKIVFEVYQKVGAMFVNDKKTGDRDPDTTGKITHPTAGELSIVGWKNQSKSGDPYTKIGVRKFQPPTPPSSPPPVSATPAQAGPDADPTPPVPPRDGSDDEIPF